MKALCNDSIKIARPDQLIDPMVRTGLSRNGNSQGAYELFRIYPILWTFLQIQAYLHSR